MTNKILTKRLTDYNFSIRTQNVFEDNKIYYVYELLKKTQHDLLSYPKFGKRCLHEILNILLIPNNLQLGSIDDSFKIKKDAYNPPEDIYLK